MDSKLLDEVSGQIIKLAYSNCDGCKNGYNSVRYHTCSRWSWNFKVYYYLQKALELLGLNKDDYCLHDIRRALDINYENISYCNDQL